MIRKKKLKDVTFAEIVAFCMQREGREYGALCGHCPNHGVLCGNRFNGLAFDKEDFGLEIEVEDNPELALEYLEEGE